MMISHNESYHTWMSMPQMKESHQTQTYLNNWVCWAATALTPTPTPPMALPLIFGVKRSAGAAGGKNFAKVSSCHIRMSHVTLEWECLPVVAAAGTVDRCWGTPPGRGFFFKFSICLHTFCWYDLHTICPHHTIHTRIHTLTHTHKQTHTHIHTYICQFLAHYLPPRATHAETDRQTDRQTDTRTHTRTHIHTLTHANTPTYTDRQTDTQTYTCNFHVSRWLRVPCDSLLEHFGKHLCNCVCVCDIAQCV